MKIDELIEKLENFKKEYGNLDVGIRRDRYNYYDFCADLKIQNINNFSLYADNEIWDKVECESFLGIY